LIWGCIFPVPAPELIPETGTWQRIAVHYWDEGLSHRGKFDHAAGVEVRWAILDHAPVLTEEELIHSSFDTRSPRLLDFDEADRGKKVYMARRWEIQREVIKGLFGAVMDVNSITYRAFQNPYKRGAALDWRLAAVKV
jgi:hypothetical protein